MDVSLNELHKDNLEQIRRAKVVVTYQDMIVKLDIQPKQIKALQAHIIFDIEY